MIKKCLDRLFILLIAVALFLATFSLTASLASYVNTMSRLKKDTVIVIDAGHGDFDPGAVSGGLNEKDLNLEIALALKDCFESGGYTVIMTRTGDETLADAGSRSISEKKKTDTHNRAALADSLDDAVLISIHQNAFADSTQHGTQVFYGTLNPSSELLAKSVQSSVTGAIQPDNKREVKKGTSSIFLLVHTEAPTILVECGFITNPQEREQLQDSEYQRKIAYSIYMGYTEYEILKDV